MGPLISSLRSPARPGRRLALGSGGLIILVGVFVLIRHDFGQGWLPQRMLPMAVAGPSFADAPPLQPGEAYARAQQRLLAKGWRRQPRARQSPCSALQGDRRCALFKELVACSSTGPGFCRFQWDSPHGQRWAVITVGGNPQGDPGSISTWFVIP